MQLEQKDRVIERLKELHSGIRQAIVRRRSEMPMERLSQVVEENESNVKYDLDVAAERHLVDYCTAWAADEKTCFVLVAEGLSGAAANGDHVVFPQTASERDAKFVLIVDPIDGSRLLTYDKRSAWALSGIAPWKPSGCTLADITVAVQSELPTSKQSLADVLIATSDSRTICERFDTSTGKLVSRFTPLPSRARTLDQGFATVSKFFPGGKEIASHIEESLAHTLVGPIQKGRAAIFDDEYISTGGQLYELACGHDRFIADIRPLMSGWLSRRGVELGLCAHPYDLCTELIARQAGVCVSQPDGSPLNAPLDTTTNVAWVGYANPTLKGLIEPHFQELLAKVLVHLGMHDEPHGHAMMGLPEQND
ncbi:MAG TPA: inositol monophosphatase [Planctomycetota bacterium]|nr:inositol monophosphatase [Planctomycetota bacterium]